MGRRIESKQHETILFPLTSESARIVVETATAQGQMMNQEWYCTSTVIVQTTIPFTTSIYDVLKTQIWYFSKVAAGQGCHFCR